MLLGMQGHADTLGHAEPDSMKEAAERNREDSIIARVLDGDIDSYRFLVNKYSARVLAFCRMRMRSEEDAQDASQEVFVRAYRSLASFKRGESFSAWLFAIAANNVRTHIRLFASRKQREVAFVRQQVTNPPDDPAGEAERAFEFQALREAVSSLPVDLRKPVELYYFAQLSVEETAKVLRLGQEAVKSRLFRARKQLREALAENVQPKRPPGGISL
ncbi:MAG: sigma-70 family RNA polymerase sigma factor [Rectinema sp.]